MSTADSNAPRDGKIKTQGGKGTSAMERKPGQQNRTGNSTKKNELVRALAEEKISSDKNQHKMGKRTAHKL
jgi:hypothetical protein